MYCNRIMDEGTKTQKGVAEGLWFHGWELVEKKRKPCGFMAGS